MKASAGVIRPFACGPTPHDAALALADSAWPGRKCEFNQRTQLKLDGSISLRGVVMGPAMQVEIEIAEIPGGCVVMDWRMVLPETREVSR